VSLAFRPLERRDFPMVDRWLGASHVAPWWPERSMGESADSTFGASVDRDDPTEVFVVTFDGRDVGLIQRYRLEDYPAWQAAVGVERAAGIDYLIGEEEVTGIGLGPQLIDEFTRLTFERDPELDAMVVAVQQANRRSWRALEKSGFTRTYAGVIDSDDPSDAGPSYVYVRERRPTAPDTTDRVWPGQPSPDGR
jgi:aminoglycoside 6'-N-acetyltransferase